MGQLALAAKITHVPSMYLSELPGQYHGCRQMAIDGHRDIARQCRALGVDTLVVFDTHWLVNSGYHINCAPEFEGLYTSSELPHFIRHMPYACQGNTALGELMAQAACRAGVRTWAHSDSGLSLEYGTLVPLRYMNDAADEPPFRVVSVSAMCQVHDLHDSMILGRALREAVEQDYDGTVAFLASGSLSHRFAPNGQSEDYLFKIWNPMLQAIDEDVVRMWQNGEWAAFTEMLPLYAEKCYGEGMMHDTAMLLGALGGAQYTGRAQVITPYFPSSGTGQINVVFPIVPLIHS